MTLYYARKFRERVLTALLLPAVTGLILSTVYLRYHYVIDVLAGIALAVLTVYLAPPLYAWCLRTAAKPHDQFHHPPETSGITRLSFTRRGTSSTPAATNAPAAMRPGERGTPASGSASPDATAMTGECQGPFQAFITRDLRSSVRSPTVVAATSPNARKQMAAVAISVR